MHVGARIKKAWSPAAIAAAIAAPALHLPCLIRAAAIWSSDLYVIGGGGTLKRAAAAHSDALTTADTPDTHCNQLTVSQLMHASSAFG